MGTVRTKVIRGKTLPWYVRNKTKFSLHDGPALLEEAIKKGVAVLIVMFLDSILDVPSRSIQALDSLLLPTPNKVY